MIFSNFQRILRVNRTKLDFVRIAPLVLSIFFTWQCSRPVDSNLNEVIALSDESSIIVDFYATGLNDELRFYVDLCPAEVIVERGCGEYKNTVLGPLNENEMRAELLSYLPDYAEVLPESELRTHIVIWKHWIKDNNETEIMNERSRLQVQSDALEKNINDFKVANVLSDSQLKESKIYRSREVVLKKLHDINEQLIKVHASQAVLEFEVKKMLDQIKAKDTKRIYLSKTIPLDERSVDDQLQALWAQSMVPSPDFQKLSQSIPIPKSASVEMSVCGDYLLASGHMQTHSADTTVHYRALFNFKTNTWSKLGSGPRVFYQSTVCYKGNIYFFGGKTWQFAEELIDETFVLERGQSVWKTFSTGTISQQRTSARGVVYGDKAYFIGGRDSKGETTSTIPVFNFEKNAWETSIDHDLNKEFFINMVQKDDKVYLNKYISKGNVRGKEKIDTFDLVSEKIVDTIPELTSLCEESNYLTSYGQHIYSFNANYKGGVQFQLNGFDTSLGVRLPAKDIILKDWKISHRGSVARYHNYLIAIDLVFLKLLVIDLENKGDGSIRTFDVTTLEAKP